MQHDPFIRSKRYCRASRAYATFCVADRHHARRYKGRPACMWHQLTGDLSLPVLAMLAGLYVAERVLTMLQRKRQKRMYVSLLCIAQCLLLAVAWLHISEQPANRAVTLDIDSEYTAYITYCTVYIAIYISACAYAAKVTL